MLEHKLAQIAEWRSESKPLPKGSAPFTSSSHFKLPIPAARPDAKTLDHRFSTEIRALQSSKLKTAALVTDVPDMITLGTARPSPEYFPWTAITMQVGDSTTLCKAGEETYDLSVALNYGYAAGSPQLLRFITEHVELIHNPPYGDWETCLTCGTTSALDILLRIFCDRGDWIIMEEYTYSGAKDAIRAHGMQVVGVGMDDFGLIPEELDDVLSNWDGAQGRKPFLLYMIPTGHNPTGVTQSKERRRAIYEVAEKHDLCIIEDDPYYFLQLGDTGSTNTEEATRTNIPTLDQYLERLPLSYLSMDKSGRVVRIDSTAKILAPGLRIGWLTASAQVVQKFLAYTELSSISPSGPSQIMTFKLLEETWGHKGLIHWLINLSNEYSRRRDTLIEACRLHLPSEVCWWTTPSAGMFLWVRIDYPKHKLLQGTRSSSEFLNEIENRMYTKVRKLGVLVCKGTWFAADQKLPNTLHFRLTFAAAPQKDLKEAISRLGKVMMAELKLEPLAKSL